VINYNDLENEQKQNTKKIVDGNEFSKKRQELRNKQSGELLKPLGILAVVIGMVITLATGTLCLIQNTNQR
jgi:hypothetical protein